MIGKTKEGKPGIKKVTTAKKRAPSAPSTSDRPSKRKPSGGSVTNAKKSKCIDDFAKTVKETPSQNWLAFMAKTGVRSQQPMRRDGDTRPNKPVVVTQTKTAQPEVTEAVAIDCEMVGGGENGKEDLLARVSVVNMHGECLYNTFVKPINDISVTDYRTRYSGVRPADLVNAESYQVVQKKVADLIKDRIIVGHDLKNDFNVMYLKHPRKRIRDTSKYKPFRAYSKKTPSLKLLAEKILDWRIQDGEHDSVTDAKAAMALYMLHRNEWEKSLRNKNRPTSHQTVKHRPTPSKILENEPSAGRKRPQTSTENMSAKSSKRR